MQSNKKISTSALAKSLNISPNELFAKFKNDKLIERKDEHWALTSLGEKIGGEYAESKQYGRYIVWPNSMAKAPTIEKQAETRLVAKALGIKFGLTANKVNSILSEFVVA